MVLHPDAQRLLDMMKASGRPPLIEMAVADARKVFAAGRTVTQPDPPDVAEVRNLTCPGPLGEIPLRLYRGKGTAAGAKLPTLVYYHGGGWVIGDLESHDQLCRQIANEGQCCVIAVDYRMAPEHKFPAAVSDSAAATRWVFDQADSLGVDASKVAVGGDSAGGNLAAVMAIMARDEYLPKISFQMLIYPATDMAMQTESVARVKDTFVLTAATMDWFIGHYLANPRDVHDWRASPARVADLSGVAPAFVLTCTHDPLCDEGRDYAQRLEREGVSTTYVHFADQMHGFITSGRIIRAAGAATTMAVAAMKSAWSE